MSDVRVENHGSVFRFVPLTPEAEAWVAANVQLEDWQRQRVGAGFTVDHRFARDLAVGMLRDGLTVE